MYLMPMPNHTIVQITEKEVYLKIDFSEKELTNKNI